MEARAFLGRGQAAGGVGPWHLSLSELAAARAPGTPINAGTVARGLGVEPTRGGLVMINGCKATLDSPVAAYLKGIRNGWESTSRVRLDVMDAYDYDYQLERLEDDFPLARTEYRKLFLDGRNRVLSWAPVALESRVRYDANLGKATFHITFDEQTELTGYMKLHLWVEAEDNDDMDLFVAVQKLDAQGKWLPTNVLGRPHPGCPGKLRVSLREIDGERSTEFQPIYPFNNPQKLEPGEIVPVEIEIYPSSRIWHKGEQLRVEVMGHYERVDWFEPFAFNTNNKGQHLVYAGGKYDSYLLVPYIPPRYISGDKVYR